MLAIFSNVYSDILAQTAEQINLKILYTDAAKEGMFLNRLALLKRNQML